MYTDPKTGATVDLSAHGDAGQQNLVANRMGLNYVPQAKPDVAVAPLVKSAVSVGAPVATLPLAVNGVVPTTPAPTIGSVYNPPTSPDPALASARSAVDTFNTNKATGVSNVDENAIRANTLAQFQAEIDATNALYAEKLNQAKISGQARIGTNTAVNARRGLIGSDFGNAETDTVNKGNDAIYAGVEAEKGARINDILTKAKTASTQAIADKTKAISEGLDSHLKFLEDSATRKTTNATKAAQYIYAQKLTPKDLTPDQLAQTASGYGVTPDDIINAYTDVKKTGDAAQVKADADAKILANKADEKPVKVGTGQELYSQNADGTYTKVASGPVKAPAIPKTPASSTYKNFTSKPTSAVSTKVNAYLASLGASQADIQKINGNEVNFYKVYNSIPKTSSTSSSLPVAP